MTDPYGYRGLVKTIGQLLRQINPALPVQQDLVLAPLTTFRIGGPADWFVEPRNAEEAIQVLDLCHREGIELFVLGGGSNILVSDRGIRGVTLSTRRLGGFEVRGQTLRLGSGLEVDRAADLAAQHGLRCLDFAAGMPGSVGGATWMNARCYERETADVFISALVWHEGQVIEWRFDPSEWAYKVSPFQTMGCLILEVVFMAEPDDPDRIEADMRAHREDRERKGHYRAPCAGSLFKNSRAIGIPTGALIDRLGLKGLAVGGARISDWHGNIVINAGGATATDVRNLAQKVKDLVFEKTGFLLEEEVLYVGEWD